MRRFKYHFRKLLNGFSAHPRHEYWYKMNDGKPPRNVRLHLQVRENSNGEPVYTMFVTCEEDDKRVVLEAWESEKFRTVRKIACGFYPSACRYFGPARMYVGI